MSDAEITFTSMILLVWEAGNNVASFVRKPNASTQPAIMVAMLHLEALRELGPFLSEFERKAGTNRPTDLLEINDDAPLRLVFEWMEKERLGWAYDSRPTSTGRVTLISFVGEICYELAPKLTAMGVPASLE